jgi:integrase
VARLPYIGMLDEPAARSGFFEREQFESLRAHLPEHLRALVTVAFHTGWRLKSEILSRQWHHVDFVGGWIKLEPGETKNNEPRLLPLYPELRTVLEAQRAYTDEIQKKTGQIIPYVFHLDGRSFKSFRRAWLTVCKAAGIPGRIPHDFRRTAVRNLERSGVPRSSAMALVGHKTESIYRRYAVKNEADLREAGERLPALHAMEPRGSKDESGPVGSQSNGLRQVRRAQLAEKVGGLGRD